MRLSQNAFYWLARVSVRSWKEGRTVDDLPVSGQDVVSLHQLMLWTNWKIFIQEVRLWYNWRISPTSGQPVGRLEDLPVLGSACWTAEGWFCFRSSFGKLGIIFLCQIRLWASWSIILLHVRLWASLRIILLQVRLWDNCGWSSCVRSGCSLSAPAHAVDQLKDCHTRGQAVVQLENLPASGHPVGRLEDHPLLGQHVGQLKDGSVSGRLWEARDALP